MKNVSSCWEKKLFLTFLFFFLFFAHWTGWNEQSRLLLTISIVDKNKFDINEYVNFTGDRRVFNKNYFSDKPPGSSFLATPFYFFSEKVFDEKFRPFDKTKSLAPEPRIWGYTAITYFVYEGLEKSVKLSMILMVFLFSSLPGAMLIVLIFRTSKILTKKADVSLFLSFIFGFATLIFPYSTVIMGNVLSLLLGFFPFYLLFVKKEGGYHIFIVSGLLLGLALLVDYLSFVLIFIYSLALIFSRKKIKHLLLYFTFLFIGLQPLFLYNLLTFHQLLIFPENLFFRLFYFMFPYSNIYNTLYYLSNAPYLDPEICSSLCIEEYLTTFSSINNIIDHAYNTLLQILFKSYRGLFFYMPFLIFSFIGLFYTLKKNKLIGIFIILLLFLYLGVGSFHSYWTGGASFGPRYLLNIIPFLIIPIAYFVNEVKNNVLTFLFLTLVLISCFHMMLTTTGWWEVVYRESKSLLRGEWYNGPILAESFDYLNPLYGHYLPAFIENGPRSRILEYSLIGEVPDIRDSRDIRVREIKLFSLNPFGFLTLKIPFLIIPVLIAIVLFIWWEELSLRVLNLKINYFVLLIVILLFFSRLEFKKIIFDKNWYPLGLNETVRWMSKEAFIYLYSPKDEKIFLNISSLPYRNKTLNLFLNEKLLNSYHGGSILESIVLKKGENKLRFVSNTCEIPAKEENLSDYRCLSIGIMNVTTLNSNELKNKIVFGSNWYSLEKYEKYSLRYFSQNASIFVLSNGTFKINISLQAYNPPKTIEVYVNNNFLGSFEINQFFTTAMTPFIEFDKDINIIKLNSREGCEVPALKENSTDFRCLSFGIINITLLSFEDFISSVSVLYGHGWYYQEREGRWMSTNSTIYLINLKQPSNLFMSLESLNRNRKLFVEIKNKTYIFEIPANEKKNISISLPSAKEVEIKLNAFPACEQPNENDKRCLSLFLRNLKTY
jgi:hypothetical protein